MKKVNIMKTRILKVNKTIDNTNTYFIYDENDFDFELLYSSLSVEQTDFVDRCNGFADGYGHKKDFVSFQNRIDAEKCCEMLIR